MRDRTRPSVCACASLTHTPPPTSLGVTVLEESAVSLLGSALEGDRDDVIDSVLPRLLTTLSDALHLSDTNADANASAVDDEDDASRTHLQTLYRLTLAVMRRSLLLVRLGA